MSNLHHEIFSLCQQVIHNIPRDSHLIFPGRSPLPVAANLKKIIPERVSNIPISRLHDMKTNRELPKDLKAHFDTWLNIKNESTIVIIDYVESGVSLYNFYKLLN
ncbi:MAG: hypothetical protein KC478_14135, partial [Bacteriovoracaceae bacterium]|nr:hypothetical protein [Bacteriovoracaceae bacterium]